MKQIAVSWFSVVQKENLKPLASVLSSTCGNLMSFKVAPNQIFIEKCFVAVFHGDEREHVVKLERRQSTSPCIWMKRFIPCVEKRYVS